MPKLSDTHHFRKTVAGACMLLAPLALLAGTIMHPGNESDAAAQIGVVADDVGLWSAAHVVLFASIVLAVPAVLGLMHMLRERSAAFGHAGGALALLGLLAFTGVVAAEVVVGQMGAAGADRAEMAALLDRVQDTAWFLVPFAILSLGFAAGLVVLAAGLVRARAVERWMAACLAIGAVLIAVQGFVSGTTLIAIAGAAFLLLGFGTIGQVVLTESDADWEHTPESAGFRPLTGMR